MPFDFSSVLNLPPQLLAALGAQASSPAAAGGVGNAVPPDVATLLQSLGGGGAAPPDPAAAPQAPPPAGPTGNIDPASFVAPRPDTPMWRNFIGNMMANGGGDPTKVMDFKDPTYRQRVATAKGAQAQQLFPNDPVGQALWMQDDPKLKEAMAKNEEVQTVGSSDSLRKGANILGTAPGKPDAKIDGATPLTYDPKTNSWNWGEQRAPSPEEKTKAATETREGVKQDWEMTNPTEDRAMGAVIAKAARGEALTAADKALLQTYSQGKVKPVFGSTDGKPPGENVWGDTAPTAAPPAPGEAATATNNGLYDPPKGFKPTPGVSRYTMKGSDGKPRLYQLINGKLKALGAAPGP